MTDSRTLRLSLITRMQAAAVIARNKGRTDKVCACQLKITALKRAFDNELPIYADGVEMIERDCRDAISMDAVRAEYARFNNPGDLPRVEAAGDRCTDPAASSFPSKRKAA